MTWPTYSSGSVTRLPTLRFQLLLATSSWMVSPGSKMENVVPLSTPSRAPTESSTTWREPAARRASAKPITLASAGSDFGACG